MKKVEAPCSICVRETAHEVLFESSQGSEEHVETNAMLRCGGCGEISLGRQIRHLPNGELEQHYYPSPVSRQKPSWLVALGMGWLGGTGENKLAELLHEIFQAVDGGQHRLAAMGIRALLEQVMIAKVGDDGSFEDKMGRFQQNGYISLIQRDAMRETIEVGHAAMHRAFSPSAYELTKALDIVEGIMAAVFDHSEVTASLAKRVPPRKRRRDVPNKKT